MGIERTKTSVTDYAPSIQIGTQPVPAYDVPGTYVRIDGRTVDIGTTNLTVNNLPIFVFNNGNASVGIGVDSVNVNHGIDTTQYDVYIVGWYASLGIPGIKWMKVYSGQAYAQVHLTSAPVNGSSVSIDFLGIRKGLINKL